MFTDKVAVVTGGGSGIGEEVARRFVEAGGSVVLNGRDGAKLEAAAGRIDPGTACDPPPEPGINSTRRRPTNSPQPPDQTVAPPGKVGDNGPADAVCFGDRIRLRSPRANL